MRAWNVGMRGNAAARLAAMAGRAAGTRRRGSIMVLIVGALAMLSVVTLVYFTIGRADRRTAQVAVERDQVEETVSRFRSYLADDIIGADALATYVDGFDRQYEGTGNNGPILFREAFDYPSTDRALLSAPAASSPYARFNPVGTFSAVWLGSGGDPRVPTDPWLADAEPTLLLSSPTIPGALDPYVRPDWGHISNVAPSGNFVNLFNLRGGNFEARSGFDTSGNALAGGMSDNLMLSPTITSLGVAPSPTYAPPGLDYKTGAQPNENTPAHWDSRQRGAARPAGPGPYAPDNPRYPLYQWADADGDGILDSRWFEMVDCGDPNAPASLLPRDDRFRYFFAVRIVDLSGRINVNTAGHFNTDIAPNSIPDADYPAGVTPADVDLLHLLRMADPYSRYVWNGVNNAPGYDRLQGPAGGPQNYNAYTPAATEDVGLLSYLALQKSIRELVVPMPAPPSTGPVNLGNPLQLLGSARDRRDFYIQHSGGYDGTGLVTVQGTPPTAQFRSGGAFGLADEIELLTYNGVNDDAALSRLEQALGGNRQAAGIPAPPPNLSPMRDNRSAQYERGSLDDAENGGRGNGVLDNDAFVKMATDPRQRLTGVNGLRPLGPVGLPAGTAGSLSSARDLKVDAAAAIRQATEPTAAGRRNATDLFRGYAEALMPHSWRTGAWKSASGATWQPDPVMRTLSYGHDPVLALWTTAHMVANSIDMYDQDGATYAAGKHTPSAFTVAMAGDPASLGVIDGADWSSGPGAQYPFWMERSGAVITGGAPNLDGTLDLDRALGLRTTNALPAGNALPSRLAQQNDLPSTMPPAVNVFGVEAQPFITEVGTLVFYTDTPVAGGGDEEWTPGSAGPPPVPPTPGPVTIEGDITSGNRDFLCQVLAIQLTNPFDSDIGLAEADVDANPPGASVGGLSNYYLEFGGNCFGLAEVDAGGATPKQIVLKGRDAAGTARDNTVTVYVMTDSLTNVAARWNNAVLAGAGGNPVSAADIETLITNQLGIVPAGGGPPVRPKLIARVDPVTGAAQSGFSRLLSGTMARDTSVKLWRTMRTPNVDLSGPNARANDLLVDRIEDPADTASPGARATLDRALPAGTNTIAGALCGPDPTGPNAGPPPLANTGYSLAIWASFKRMDDPKDPALGRIPRGALPAYCVEAPRFWSLGPVNSSLHNIANPTGPFSVNLQPGTFSPPKGDPDAGIRGTESLNGATGVGGNLYTEMGTVNPVPDPTYKTCDNALKGTIREWPEAKGIAGAASETIPDGLDASGNPLPYSRMYAEVALNDRNFLNADNAGVLRVADMLLPLAVGPMTVPDPTLSTTPLYDPQQDGSWLTLGEAMAVSLGYASPPTSGAAFERWRPLSGLGGWVWTGPNLPPSQGRPAVDRGNLVLNDFAPFENSDADPNLAFSPTGDRRRSPGVPLALAVMDHFQALPSGTIAHSTPGVVNLNTAPVTVLSSLPMLSPAWRADGSAADWWGGANLNPDGLSRINQSDVAATLAAYRDKTVITNRTNSTTYFRDVLQPLLDNSFSWDGRTQTHRIQAARETPGLASLGEVACLVDPQATGVPADRVQPRDQSTYLGDDRSGTPNRSGGAGTSSILYRASGAAATATPTEANEIADDYAEKLLLLEGLGNTVSVRSDVFAVWFIVSGYQRSDTEGLGSGDPLWPTISRRYVMVVDRSNVTRLGDKPRILFCTEVPR
ncbi:MAG: hypothetical protein IT437_11465 [Phycisphaerales bacterium]|nr:hypothetical protein [Phycisphaerales bacterium]